MLHVENSKSSLANKLKDEIKDNTSLIKWFEASSRNDMQTLYVSAIYNFVNRGEIIDDTGLLGDISIAINSINNNIKYLVDKYKGDYISKSLDVKEIYKICFNLLTDTTGNLLMEIIKKPEFNKLDPKLILKLSPQSQLIIETKNIIAHKMTLLKFSSDLFIISSMNNVTEKDDKLIAENLLKSDIFSMGCVDYAKALRVDARVVALLDILRNNETIIDRVENKSGDAADEDVSGYAADALADDMGGYAADALADDMGGYAADALTDDMSGYAADAADALAAADAEDAVVGAMAAVMAATADADDMATDAAIPDRVMDHSLLNNMPINQDVFNSIMMCFNDQPPT